jgi:hypothetical protein
MLPALLSTAAFWDALIVLIWLVMLGLVLLFALAAATLPPQMAISGLVSPILSAAFVLISVARFLALRVKYPRWIIYLATGQLGATLTLLGMGTSRPNMALNVVEHVLAGCAGAVALHVFFSFLPARPLRTSQATYIKELMKRQQQHEQQQPSKL